MRPDLLEHFTDAAAACEPLPFYVYEFAARSGYAVPLQVIDSLREEAANFRGLKVSDTPWDRFAQYLIEGLDVFVGPEFLIAQGRAAGAVGAVSALTSAFPELIAAEVHASEQVGGDLGGVRSALERFPFHAAPHAGYKHSQENGTNGQGMVTGQ